MDNPDILLFLKSRRSIRQFKQTPVSTDVLCRILDVATYSPSAHNKQPWRFIVVSNTEMKTKLGLAITGKFQRDMAADGFPVEEIKQKVEKSINRINEAPAVIVICMDKSHALARQEKNHSKKEEILDVQSIAMAGLQLLLAAQAEGLGGTWICWPLFAPLETRRALDLPVEWEPQGMLFIGYPDENPIPPARKPLLEVARFIP